MTEQLRQMTHKRILRPLGGRAQVNPPRSMGTAVFQEATDWFTVRGRQRLTWGMAGTILSLLVFGWMITHYLGNSARQEAWVLNQHDAWQFRQECHGKRTGRGMAKLILSFSSEG